MTVRLMYASWGGTPHSYHVEVDDDGRAAESTTFGHRVGRFARDLSESERTTFEAALQSARAADVPPPAPPDPVASPSGAGLTLLFDDTEVELGGAAPEPDGAGQLARIMLDLADELVDSPLSALELVVDGAPLEARLGLVGTEKMAVRGRTLAVTATAYDAEMTVLGHEQFSVEVELDGPVAPGWVLPLVADLGLPPRPPGGVISIGVEGIEADALGDGVLRQAGLAWQEGLEE